MIIGMDNEQTGKEVAIFLGNTTAFAWGNKENHRNSWSEWLVPYMRFKPHTMCGG